MLRGTMSITPPSAPNLGVSAYSEPTTIDPTPIQPGDDTGLFVRSISARIGGAIVGAVVYAAFILITHIQIGYLAIGVAWLIAKAMTTGQKDVVGEGTRLRRAC